MANGEQFDKQGKSLTCTYCGNKTFFTRETLLNTAGMTFMNLDWANQTAENYICERCGYIMWFLPVPKL